MIARSNRSNDESDTSAAKLSTITNNPDKKINTIQQKGRCSGLMKLLVHFGLLLLLQISLSGTAGARVYAYIDTKGVLHCAPVNGGERRKLGLVCEKSKKSTVLSKKNSISRSLNELIQAAAMEHRVDPFLIKRLSSKPNRISITKQFRPKVPKV